jgi:nucleoredoxin
MTVLGVALSGYSAEPAKGPANAAPAGAAATTRPAVAATQPSPATQPADELACWKAMFPAGLVDAYGQSVDVTALRGKIVGVYYSASWCLSCREFTPDLVKFRDKNAAAFEIVFVSADRTQDDQYKYMVDAGMKGPAVQWRSQPARAILEKFQARIIPTLIVLGPGGREITRDGRADVSADPDHALAKWKSQAGPTAVAQATPASPAK